MGTLNFKEDREAAEEWERLFSGYYYERFVWDNYSEYEVNPQYIENVAFGSRYDRSHPMINEFLDWCEINRPELFL